MLQPRFYIEAKPGKGERGVRATTGAPKVLTYAHKARIVDGDDGRTYIAELNMHNASILIMRGDMKFQEEYISGSDSRYQEVLNLFN